MEKLSIGIVFGGRSGEHEVSLVSASSVIEVLDLDTYSVVEIGITKEGKWYAGEGCLEAFKRDDFDSLKPVCLSMDPENPGLILDGVGTANIDIFFPILHGPFGEDGTIQGLFEMMRIPYVGCDVLASSTAMDKLQSKAIWKAAGLPIVPFIGFNRSAWEFGREAIIEDIENDIGLPCFVKPVNMGSSVGITKVKDESELVAAIDLAAKFDRKVVVEKAINVREIECAVLGNEDPIACAIGEVIVASEFYDFNDKYIDGKSRTEIPANVSKEDAEKIMTMSLKAFKSLDCSGLSRVDCFIDTDTDEIYLNEINTLPGFTSISMYPKMAKHYGLSYPDLVARLIELGFERHRDRSRNQVAFDSGSDWFTA